MEGPRAHCARLVTSALVVLFGLVGCDRRPEGRTTAPSGQQASTPPPEVTSAEPLRRRPAPARMVAIGDLHGDLDVAKAGLRLAGALDGQDHWAGGELVVVQTGDQVDRGDNDRAILDLYDRLGEEAVGKGGAVIALIGNHEVMNVQLNFDYVTPGGFRAFVGVPGLNLSDPKLTRFSEQERSRAAAFLPGGVYAKRLGKRDTVALIGDTLFVHGGVLPKHAKYGLAKINREVSAWMSGESAEAPRMVVSEDGPVWARRYSAAADAEDCKLLRKVLDSVGAMRMVVGHTVQRGGISSACDRGVWRIDVGMSKFYGGSLEVLEIVGSEVRPLMQAGMAAH